MTTPEPSFEYLSEHIFMIGIGGMGMAPLAIYLRQAGFRVTGYDDALKDQVKSLLEANGVALAENGDIPEDVTRVVYSSAVGPGHSVYDAAFEKGLVLIKRGAMLAELASVKKLIAVVGSHGKTTTAGMIISALSHIGFDFDYVLGGLFADETLYPANYQGAEWMVAEVDESDGTIEYFNPTITLLVNYDWDHGDFYPDEEKLIVAFRRLLKRTKLFVFAPESCEALRSLTEGVSVDVFTFGDGKNSDFRGYYYREAESRRMQLSLNGRFSIGGATVNTMGKFNASNAVAALAVVQHLNPGLHPSCLRSFPGIARRQACLYDSSLLTIYEDYAHHPNEMRALFEFVRSAYGERKLIVVFQPHRYSRTLNFKKAFASTLEKADEAYLLDVFSAGEIPREGGMREDILAEAGGSLTSVDTLSDLYETLEPKLHRDSTVLLFVGAGDIDRWAKQFIDRLRNEELWWRQLRTKLDNDAYMCRDEPLADKTTLRVGGVAKYYIEPTSLEELQVALAAANDVKIPVFFLGRGSNLIVHDDGFSGLVIRLNRAFWKEIKLLSNERMWVGAGVRLKQICGEACKAGLAGFEFLEGIPGSLGGSLRMNAGAMGGWIFDIVEEVHFVTMDGVLRKFHRDQFNVGYRNCQELQTAIAVGAILHAKSTEAPEAIKENLERYSSARKKSQPRGPSAGCIFKNPEDGYAGQLIEESGLKGYRLGSAEVSDVHGNFIINCGGATSRDVILLIQEIRRQVKAKRGVELQPEVMLMGKDWDQVL